MMMDDPQAVVVLTATRTASSEGWRWVHTWSTREITGGGRAVIVARAPEVTGVDRDVSDAHARSPLDKSEDAIGR